MGAPHLTPNSQNRHSNERSHTKDLQDRKHFKDCSPNFLTKRKCSVVSDLFLAWDWTKEQLEGTRYFEYLQWRWSKRTEEVQNLPSNPPILSSFFWPTVAKSGVEAGHPQSPENGLLGGQLLNASSYKPDQSSVVMIARGGWNFSQDIFTRNVLCKMPFMLLCTYLSRASSLSERLHSLPTLGGGMGMVGIRWERAC